LAQDSLRSLQTGRVLEFYDLVDITQEDRGDLDDARGHLLKGNDMQEVIDTRSCQIKLEQGKPVLYADGAIPQKPTFIVFADSPAELSFEAQSPLHFADLLTIFWQDDASPRNPIDEPPSISHSLSDSNTTLVITVRPAPSLQTPLTYHFTMHLSDGINNYEVGAGANEPASGDGAQYGVDPTIVENPPNG
jgi:hypothetical protein